MYRTKLTNCYLTGGWFSDYLVLPLHSYPDQSLILPNHGQFTSYQKQIPALLVGTEEEWQRMSKQMFEFFKKYDKANYSDMLALRDIQRQTNSCLFDDQDVLSIADVYKTELRAFHTIHNPMDFDKICPRLTWKRAIHFSHAGCSEVSFCHKQREIVVSLWIRACRQQCLLNNFG